MPIIFIQNEEIFYTRSGNLSSPCTLLFIHGAASSHSSLAMLEARLTNYNCIMIDLPCHGQSQGNIRKNVESYADFIEAFVFQLQKEQVITQHVTLIGCSMGGFISIELAIRKFFPIKGMITLSSGADPGDYSEIIPYITESVPETFDPCPLLRKSFGPNSSEQYINSVIDYMDLPTNEVCYYDFSTVKHFKKLEQVKEVTIPVLAIIGDHDNIIPPICSIHLLENMPHCDLAVIPASGHTVLLDACDIIASIVLDFLSKYKFT